SKPGVWDLPPARAAPLSRGGATAAPGVPAPPGGATGPGGKSREKVVKILVSMTPDEILEKLKKEASS
uniref:Uncharacterized protein n=1 Tax=Calidris pygmaea TaxID=425635 RepID=A0A8C3J8A2_9CHAR